MRPWFEDKQDFIPEEDGDSGHGGTGRRNPVRRAGWVSICGSRIAGQFQKKCILENSLTGDDNTLKGLIKEGWPQVSQEFFNSRAQEIPKRLRDVICWRG